MIYRISESCIPMKRVDFDPNGDRNIQNRGISGYERISWDEALDIIATEIKRIKRKTVRRHHVSPDPITCGATGYRPAATSAS